MACDGASPRLAVVSAAPCHAGTDAHSPPTSRTHADGALHASVTADTAETATDVVSVPAQPGLLVSDEATLAAPTEEL